MRVESAAQLPHHAITPVLSQTVVCMCACMYVSVYVTQCYYTCVESDSGMYVCMYVCMYVYVYVTQCYYTCVESDSGMYVCVCMHVSVYVT